MINKDIYRNLGGIDPELIEKAAPTETTPKKTRNIWLKCASLVACLFLIITTSTLGSCSKKVPISHLEISDTEELIQEDVSISTQKYKFRENNVLLLSAQNNTATHHSITVNVEYFDSEKNLLKKEQKTFDQFASGYQHNFIFNPQIAFESYEYTFTLGEASTPLIAPDVYFTLSELVEGKTIIRPEGENAGMEWVKAIFAGALFEYKGDTPAFVGGEFALIGNNGEIYNIYSSGKSPVYPESDTSNGIEIVLSKSNKLIWPIELQEGVSFIFSLTTAEVYDGKIPGIN